MPIDRAKLLDLLTTAAQLGRNETYIRERAQVRDDITSYLESRMRDEIAAALAPDVVSEPVAITPAARGYLARAAYEAREVGVDAATQAALDTAARLGIRPKQVCECIHTCAEDPATVCSLSGAFHTHPDEPCPIHPDAPCTP